MLLTSPLSSPLKNPVRDAFSPAGSGVSVAEQMLAIFAGGEKGSILDLRTTSGQFQDTAATSPVTATNQLIARVNDASPNAANATQSTAGNRPRYFPFDNSRNGAFYQRTGDALTVTLAAGTYYTAIATPNGAYTKAEFLTSVVHGGGAYTLPQSNCSAIVILDRDFTAAEKLTIRAWFASTPIISTPADRAIVTVSVANTITADTTASVTADGTGIGTANPTLSWTPGALDANTQLAASGKPNTITVGEANRMNVNFSTWSATNVTVTGSETDPDGGTAAYKLTCAVNASAANHYLMKAMSPVSAVANSGFEVWAEYNASLPVLMIYPLEGGATHYAYVNLSTGETQGNFSSCKIVETRGNWKRVQFKTAQGATVTNVILYGCKTIGANSDITAGTEYMKLYAPRGIDAVLPFSEGMRTHAKYVGVVSSLDRWAFRSMHLDSETDGNQERYIDVLLPTTYTVTKKYPVIYVADAEPFVNVLADSLQTIRTAGLHDTYDVIFARSQYKSTPWYGTKNDGTIQCDIHFADVLPSIIDRHYSTIPFREGRSILGFSKGGWGAASLLLRRSEVFGYAAAWDAPWNLAYGDYETVTVFGSAPQMAIYNPADILVANKAVISDKARLVIAGYNTFDAHLTTFKSLLDANSVPYSYDRTSRGAHDWNSGWLSGVVASLVGLRG